MDRNPDPLKPPRPPWLAERLIGMLSQRNNRDALLGDLAEEYADRSFKSRRSAWIWYWEQVAQSAPHLLYVRFSAKRQQNILFGLLAILLGTVFMLAWDIVISRNSARMVATWDSPPTLTVIRAVYFSVLSLGAAICGLLIARATFSNTRTFWRNVTLYLAPVFLLLASLAMSSAIERGLLESSGYLLMRTGLIALGMLIAAAFTFYRTQNR